MVSCCVIQEVVSQYYGTDLATLRSKRRDHLIMARHVAIYLTRLLTDHSLQDIGRHFGDRDHSTVFYMIARLEALAKTDRKLVNDLEALKAVLN